MVKLFVQTRKQSAFHTHKRSPGSFLHPPTSSAHLSFSSRAPPARKSSAFSQVLLPLLGNYPSVSQAGYLTLEKSAFVVDYRFVFMKSQVMFRTSSSHQYQRSKGLRVKHVIQLVMLVIIVTWVSFQFKHAQRNASVPTPHKAERSRDFLAEKSVDWKWKADGNILGRKGGNVPLDADKHQEQTEVENIAADPDDVSEKEREQEDDNLEENTKLEMDLTDNPALLDEETEIARESQDEVDEDDDVDAGSRGIGDDLTTENDNLTEDFFNEAIENREDIEKVPSEVDDEQTNSEDGNENDYIESEILQFQSEANKQEFTDFEGKKA